MTTLEELEPCPFCLAKLKAHNYIPAHCEHPYNGCSIQGKDFPFYSHRSWNTRPREAELEARNKDLERKLEVAERGLKWANGYVRANRGQLDLPPESPTPTLLDEALSLISTPSETAASDSGEVESLKRQLEAARVHAYVTDAGRICDADKRINYREQLKRSEEYVNLLIAKAATPHPTPAEEAGHE
ncbi:hypothetical protein J8F10_24325 [Gemmata sp. G18]|uniref:Uncharacterized protein n=1 Tax=Gemmata palustris TaxID=2822762 RepID=A0ABS5BXK1_9BACT|nr:hypothetical protein [Gemmata palustris]MBP3958388.1 hypothetical protein [Gemmata palustris]